MSKLSKDQLTTLKGIFDEINTNGDEWITREELKNMFTKLEQSVDEDYITEMIEKADLNGDGKIDFNEFINAASQ